MPKVFFVFIFITTFIPVAAQNAAAIVEGARNRIDVKAVSSRSRLILSDKKGGKTERLIDQFSKDSADGNRAVIVFQRPAQVAGTRFLTIDNKTGSSDKWIFLPSFGKVRRLSASEGAGSFVGTDLSYDDISSAKRDVSLDTHTFLREDSFNGKAVYVIESIPKDKNYQYSKMLQFIGKNDKITYKLELYNKKGALYKTLEVLELKNIQGYETIVKQLMTTVTAGTSTEIIVESIIYDEPIPDGVFTQSYLETGKL